MGKSSQALEVYNHVIERLGTGGAPEIEPRVANEVATALLYKIGLLLGAGREDESIAACDAIVSRFGTYSGIGDLLLIVIALFTKGMLHSKKGDSRRALDAYNQILDRIDAAGETVAFNSFVADAIHHKGLEFIQIGQQEEAIAAFDEVVKLYAVSQEPRLAETIAGALASKIVVLDQMDRTISEGEFSLLLECLEKGNKLPDRGIEALTCFIDRVGPARSLELIQGSPAAHLLQPLVTALQQVLGQSPQVAKEVDEVAKDIRDRLAGIRARRHQTQQD